MFSYCEVFNTAYALDTPRGKSVIALYDKTASVSLKRILERNNFVVDFERLDKVMLDKYIILDVNDDGLSSSYSLTQLEPLNYNKVMYGVLEQAKTTGGWLRTRETELCEIIKKSFYGKGGSIFIFGGFRGMRVKHNDSWLSNTDKLTCKFEQGYVISDCELAVLTKSSEFINYQILDKLVTEICLSSEYRNKDGEEYVLLGGVLFTPKKILEKARLEEMRNLSDRGKLDKVSDMVTYMLGTRKVVEDTFGDLTELRLYVLEIVYARLSKQFDSLELKRRH